MPTLDNILVSPEKEQAIKDKAPDKMPLNPTAQGWSGSAVRSFFAQALVGASDSLLSELKDKMIIIKDAFEDTQGLVADGFACAYFKNNTGNIIYRGQAVYVSGRVDSSTCVNLAYASPIDTYKSIGVSFALDDIAVDASGFFVMSGVLDGIVPTNVIEDVSQLVDLTTPAQLYLSQTSGKLTIVSPSRSVLVGRLIENSTTLTIQLLGGAGEKVGQHVFVSQGETEPSEAAMNDIWIKIVP